MASAVSPAAMTSPKYFAVWIWPLTIIAGALTVGVLLRGLGISENVYWVDEVHTMLRLAGFTKDTMTPLLKQPLAVADLGAFQGTAAPLPAALQALAQHPEHPPLYYVTAWGWLALWQPDFGHAVGLLRWVSVLFGLLALPATYWLCWELWQPASARFSSASGVAALGLAIVTLSPLHVLYAQEAREYSLWTLLILLSGAMLLRSLRLGGRKNWSLYGITASLGIYSHLLFGVVMLAYGLYVARVGQAKQLRAYLVMTAGAIATFLPWIWVGLQQRGQLKAVASAVQRDTSLGYLMGVGSRNLNRVFFNGDWGAANLLIVVLGGYSLYYLWRCHRSSALFLTLLIALPILVLLTPDLLWGGIRSTRIRYLIPAYLGIQIAIAHLFATQIGQHQGWKRRLWGLGLGLLMLGSGGASLATTQTAASWAKSDKAVYYPAMADAINATENSWVVTDSSTTYLLALSRLLAPKTMLQHVNPRRLPQEMMPAPDANIFLFDPSPRLRRVMERRYGPLELRVEQNSRFQLWQLRGPS